MSALNHHFIQPRLLRYRARHSYCWSTHICANEEKKKKKKNICLIGYVEVVSKRARERALFQMVRGQITCSTCHLVDKINDSIFICSVFFFFAFVELLTTLQKVKEPLKWNKESTCIDINRNLNEYIKSFRCTSSRGKFQRGRCFSFIFFRLIFEPTEYSNLTFDLYHSSHFFCRRCIRSAEHMSECKKKHTHSIEIKMNNIIIKWNQSRYNCLIN